MASISSIAEVCLSEMDRNGAFLSHGCASLNHPFKWIFHDKPSSELGVAKNFLRSPVFFVTQLVGEELGGTTLVAGWYPKNGWLMDV